MKNILRYTALLFFGLIFTTACEEPDCTSALSDTINISFYKLDENELDTVYVNNLSVIGSDSVFIKNKQNISKVVLPANPDTSAITFIFNVREYGIDTLTVTYQNGARLISEDCGTELVYTKLNYSRSDFDSIRVVNTILAEQINEDIRVYNN